MGFASARRVDNSRETTKFYLPKIAGITMEEFSDVIEQIIDQLNTVVGPELTEHNRRIEEILALIPFDFGVEVQKGEVDDHALVHKFGRNDNVQNANWEHVNLLGSTSWPLSAATTVRVKAGNAADAAAGNGAREITVQGIDSNFDELSETIVTDGTTASSVTTASFWRVHRAWVSAAGTYGAANTGVVVIENGAGGTDLISIGAGEGQSQFAAWTVPVGKTAYLWSAFISVDTNQSADVRMFTRADIDDTSAPLASKRLKLYFDGLKDTMAYSPKSPGSAIPAKSDIWWEARGAGGSTEVSVDFELLVVDN